MSTNWTVQNSVADNDGTASEDAPQIALTIRAVDGREASLQVPYSIHISALKELVALEFNENVDRVRLIYRGKRLNPEDTLCKYISKNDINEAHCLHVVFRATPPRTQEETPANGETQRSSTSVTSSSITNTTSTTRNGTTTVLHSLPGTLSLDTLRLGPSTQFSVTTSSNIPGMGHGDIMNGPAMLQSLISSLGHVSVAHLNENGSTAQPQTTVDATQPSITSDGEEELPTTTSINASANTSGHALSASAGNHSVPNMMTTNAAREAGESGATGTRTSESQSTRPQQVRVTVGSLPVSLGSGGLGQLFQTVLGQLASPSQAQQTNARTRRISTRQRAASLFPEYPLRSVQTGFIDQPDVEAQPDSSSRPPSQNTLPPGVTAFLRRTVGILSDSRRGVTRASESILETLEDLLTQSSRRGPGRQHSTGIVTLSQRQTAGLDRASESVWVSNESVSEELPWETLTQLAQVIRRATGWELPDLAQESVSNSGSLSLARFLLSFQQLTSISSAVLSQIEAWQRGTGRLRVADIGNSIEILALSSSIQANLASLFSWLFLHLSRHVDASMLYERMHWDSLFNDRQSARHDDDDDAFVDAHESPSHECAPNTTATGTAPQGSTSADIGDGASAVSRKRSSDEEAIEAAVSSADVMDETTTAKKQRITDSCRNGSGSEDNPSVDILPSSSNSSSASRLESVITSSPAMLQNRFRKWILNPEVFSRAVLAQARVRPASDAYSSNSLTEVAPVLAVKHFFTLCWNQTASRCNVPIDNINHGSEHLSMHYIAFLLSELMDQVRYNPDFLAEPHRFPHIEKVLSLFRRHRERTA